MPSARPVSSDSVAHSVSTTDADDRVLKPRPIVIVNITVAAKTLRSVRRGTVTVSCLLPDVGEEAQTMNIKTGPEQWK